MHSCPDPHVMLEAFLAPPRPIPEVIMGHHFYHDFER